MFVLFFCMFYIGVPFVYLFPSWPYSLFGLHSIAGLLLLLSFVSFAESLAPVLTDPPIDQSGPVSSYVDQGVVLGVASSVSPFSSIYSGASVLPDSDISSVIQREYPVGTITWPSSAASGVLLGTISFPEALFSIPFISTKLKDYRFFRGSVKVTVRISGSSFLSGAILVSTDTAVGADDGASRDASVVNSSGFPHMILSASSASAIEFDIPWMWQDPFIDLTHHSSAVIGAIDFQVLAALQSSTAVVAPTLTLTVFASFYDVTVDTPASGSVLTVSDSITRTSDGAYPSL